MGERRCTPEELGFSANACWNDRSASSNRSMIPISRTTPASLVALRATESDGVSVGLRAVGARSELAKGLQPRRFPVQNQRIAAVDERVPMGGAYVRTVSSVYSENEQSTEVQLAQRLLRPGPFRLYLRFDHSISARQVEQAGIVSHLELSPLPECPSDQAAHRPIQPLVLDQSPISSSPKTSRPNSSHHCLDSAGPAKATISDAATVTNPAFPSSMRSIRIFRLTGWFTTTSSDTT